MAVKWTERWIARAQRKADLRTERFRRHEEGVRAGAEPPNFLERIAETGEVIVRHHSAERHANADWPLAARPSDESLRLAHAWLTWVKNGPVCGPDGVEVTIWIRSAGHDLPFHYLPGDQAWVPRQQLPASRDDYVVCVRRLPAGPVQSIGSFASETSARWYAVGLAWQVREAGITALRPASHGMPAHAGESCEREDDECVPQLQTARVVCYLCAIWSGNGCSISRTTSG